MSKRIAIVLLALLVPATGGLRAQDLRYATSPVRMRVDATTDSHVIGTVPLGGRVEVRACAVDWCWIEYAKRTGYVAERYLSAVPQIVRGSHGGYVNALGNFVSSPKARIDGPPAGATARCRDGTYSFSRSRSGTCSNHGGVSRWL
jgi:uncharacterized protein YraI